MRGAKKRDALSEALRFIKFRARSEWEVREKLRRSGYDEQQIERTLAVLKEKGFVDDEKFAYLYAYDSLTLRKKGPFRIRHELRQLHVDESFIESALRKTLSEVDLKEIVAQLTEGLDERKKREKLYRHGFSSEFSDD